ncbi:aminotransferase class I/II-fold pyridoxal phosphate-dependent enzyme [Streptomyces lancefieldiae]|uniref:Aminotransferase class I/II-fold pyridoxal phosphate-dependent enzyme n=1 Tax=Streptomyces lancefieldiae TaxID=3075520 RepID=A0ABU3AKV6_9ACTN|nr:aminotransferase class I/II-fold pyridoxal phosphate-dependent enzyme [Streptomyces sp. DSM 40712]MDT0610823.1 aminotransferase class I/II-fold pyridoxal phosphate-dependent enzyme [Streptomyces sp. DSM 40712]
MPAELAVLGGTPSFDEPLHIGRPNVPDERRTMARIQQALDRRWLTAFGPLVKQFERDIAAAAGVKHCVAMCNASVALQVLIRAAGLRGEVVLPSFTFIATAHTLQWEGVTPVFCDIDEKTGNLDPAHARRLITERTTGIMGVHLWGHPAPTEDLAALADEHGLRLFYDSAHAIGSSRYGRPVGSFGDAEVFSFHATKFINSFEGGAVVTDDEELAERVRAIHNYGRGEGSVVSSLGTNAKMTEVAAAMGITSLENMSHLIDVNRGHHNRYAEGLADVPGVVLREPLPENTINHQYVVVEVDERAAGVGRDALAAALTADNVLVRTHFDPGCHRTEPYVRAPRRHAPLPLPRTEALGSRVVMLPTGNAVGSAEVDRVCALIREIVDHGEAVTAAVAAAGN